MINFPASNHLPPSHSNLHHSTRTHNHTPGPHRPPPRPPFNILNQLHIQLHRSRWRGGFCLILVHRALGVYEWMHLPSACMQWWVGVTSECCFLSCPACRGAWESVTLMKGSTLTLSCPLDNAISVEWQNPHGIMFFNHEKGTVKEYIYIYWERVIKNKGVCSCW